MYFFKNMLHNNLSDRLEIFLWIWKPSRDQESPPGEKNAAGVRHYKYSRSTA